MASVADELRAKTRQQMLAMTPDQRLSLAFALGDGDLETFRSAHGLSREDALRELQRRRQMDRVISKSMLEIIG